MSTAEAAVRQDKYHAEKVTFGRITNLTMHGTVGEMFEGRKVAASLRTKKIVINMHDVRRFASWGMSEWMDFLRVTSASDIYLVECSTYAASQLTIVTGLLGHAKLVSFYASYRCRNCNDEIESLFVIPRDRAAIRGIENSSQTCPACGGPARLEDYPAAFFETVAGRPPFDIDDEALAFMRTHLKYDLSPDLTRFRAFRRVNREYTYLRLSGNVATLPVEHVARAAQGTALVDLERIVVDPGQVDHWRKFIPAALPNVKSLQLLQCPPGFLEAAMVPEDFSDRLKVRTFGAAFTCSACGAPSSELIDVATHLEELVEGRVPPGRCPRCRAATLPIVSPELTAILRALPARDRDGALDNFLLKCRSESSDALENCLVTQQPAAPAAPRRRLYVALSLAVLAVGAVALLLTKPWQKDESPGSGSTTTATGATPQPPLGPTFKRPEWIVSDIPQTAYCHDLINRLMCIGVSSYTSNKEEGAVEASDAALEELVSAVGLKISEPYFKDTLIARYSDLRTKALSALQAAELQRSNDPVALAAYTSANDTVRNARKRIVGALRASAGAAVPAQRTDWYWEEYAKDTGGTEILVFVRFDVPLDAVRLLVEKYSATATVLGSTAMTAFPELAWGDPKFTGGALISRVGPPLAAAGVAASQIVVGVGDQRVADVTGFAKRVDDTSGPIKLLLETDDGRNQVIEIKR
jgi:hypothetical protein